LAERSEAPKKEYSYSTIPHSTRSKLLVPIVSEILNPLGDAREADFVHEIGRLQDSHCKLVKYSLSPTPSSMGQWHITTAACLQVVAYVRDDGRPSPLNGPGHHLG